MVTRAVLLLLALLGECSCAASAATLYIGTSGSDNNSCTSASAPCATFNGAYVKAKIGDTVLVAAGSYGSQNMLYDTSKAGSAGVTSHVTFQPASGAAVTIAGNFNFGRSRMEGGAAHVTLSGFTITGDVSILGCGVPDNTPCPPDATSPGNDYSFLNLRVKGSYAFSCSSCSNVLIDGGVWGPDTYNSPCTSDHHPEIQSAYTQVKRANHITIQNSEWKNFARCATTEHTECLQVEPADDITLRGNRFHDCDTIIVNFANDLANSKSAAGYRAPNNVLIENNFFGTAKDATGGPTYFALNIRECTNCTVRYNSWTQAPRMPTGEISLNNRFEGNVGPMASSNCGIAGVTYSYNVWSDAKCSSTDKQAPSGFVNASAVDLHLTAGSVAIGAGNPADYPATDIDGKTRVSPPDAGAAQYGSSGQTQAPTPPANLSVAVK